MAYITGLSHECPSNVVKQHAFESIVKTLYPGCADSIGYGSDSQTELDVQVDD